MIEVLSFPPEKIAVPERAVLPRLGIRGGKGLPAEFRELYQRSFREVRAAARPLALVRELPCSWDASGVFLTVSGQELKGRLVERQLTGCHDLTLLLVTLGPEVDRLIEDAHEKEDELLSFFCDAVSSELAEYTARKLDTMLRERKKGAGASARISPGYSDLSLELNAWFVDMLEGERHGISCRKDSFVLRPRKTISAFIGWRESS